MPFAWMAVAACAEPAPAPIDIASLFPAGPFSLANFADAWSAATFRCGTSTPILLCGGILAVQCVTVSLAGYAFARLRFRGRNTLFYAFLLQLMLVPPILIVPNMTTLVALHLYDTLAGVAAPYCRLGVRRVPDAADLPHHPARLRGSGDGRRRLPAAHHLPRAAAAGAARAWPRSRSSRSPRTGTSSCGR